MDDEHGSDIPYINEYIWILGINDIQALTEFTILWRSFLIENSYWMLWKNAMYYTLKLVSR